MHTYLYNQLSQYIKGIYVLNNNVQGYKHCKRVVSTAIDIVNIDYNANELYESILPITIICAWLHDIYDEKSDFNEEIKVGLSKMLQDSKIPLFIIDQVIKIINHISFSKEREVLEQEYYELWKKGLNDFEWLIRDIVSDADKLDSMGYRGVKRCIGYIVNKTGIKVNEENRHTILLELLDHMEERLLCLRYHYIKTKEGKKRSITLHDQMIEFLIKLIENPSACDFLFLEQMN